MLRQRFVLFIAVLVVAVPLLAGDHGPAACCASMAGVQRTVTHLDNGVRVTLVGQDQATVTKLQAQAASCPDKGCSGCPMHAEGVTRTVENTASGVIITATSTNRDLVAALHKHASAPACGASSAAGKGSCCKAKAGGSACQRGGTV